jgi:hypothetical protein
MMGIAQRLSTSPSPSSLSDRLLADLGQRHLRRQGLRVDADLDQARLARTFATLEGPG